MSLRVNSQHFPFHYFALCSTYLHFALPYFVLCMISIVFPQGIKMDKICVFRFKLPQNIVSPSAELIRRCGALIKFSASAY